MSASLRVLAAAVCIAAASIGGAIALSYDRISSASPSSRPIDRVALIAATDVRALLTQSQDHRLLESAYRRVVDHFYKPVNPQLLLNGEQHELVDYLKKKQHVRDPQIPRLFATGDESRDVELLQRDLKLAQTTYGRNIPNSELTQAALRGMLGSLGDPYTNYLSAKEINSLNESLRGGDFGGIGVYIFQELKTNAIIVDPIEGLPAIRAGVRPGDEVLSVNGESTHGLKLDIVEGKIRGSIGSVVQLTLRSKGSETNRLVRIVREKIFIPSVKAKMEDGFEYVRLADFGQTSYDEVRKAMLDGKAHGARGYILDLRNNGGGLLDAAVQISSLFIPEGVIVSQIDRGGARETKSATHESIGIGPLVVLVNKYTASASEITAGAVQDYKAGRLIGTKTFGKGVVQSIFNMSDGGALKITTARYETPLGRDIHHKGIEPDVVVDQPVEATPIIDTPKDEQLAAAKAYLRNVAHR